MTRTRLVAAALFVLCISACQQPSDENIAIDESANMAGADIETLPPDETAEPANMIETADNAANAVTPAASETIPAQYHGRWGMVAADCTSTRGDAKGLITIDAKSIRFYESTAMLKEQRPAIATSFAGLFTFTGEGQSWEKVMTFTRNGDTLKRAEEAGSFSYQRCA